VLNRFNVLNDPVNWIDPFGLLDKSITSLSTPKLRRLIIATESARGSDIKNIQHWQNYIEEYNLPKRSIERLNERIHQAEGRLITYDYYLPQLKELLENRELVEDLSSVPCM